MYLIKKIIGVFRRDPPDQESQLSRSTVSASTSITQQKPPSSTFKQKEVPQNVTQNTPQNVPQNIPQNVLPKAQNQPLKMLIEVVLINKQLKVIEVSKGLTGRQLKEHIFSKLSQQLEPNSISLKYEGTKITNNMKISQLKVVVGNRLKIVQEKIDLSELSTIIADAHGIDPLTDEVGTAKMSCGHHIGKDSMTMLVRSLIQANKYEIRCPNKNEDDNPCLAQWSFQVCKKIGVFTKTELSEFQNGLSLNWIKQNAKQCPKCKQSISKYQLKSNRVVCPKCKFGDFCYLCLNLWKGQNNQFCGNQQCKFLNDFVSNSPWNRIFKLKDRNDQNKPAKEYTTPQYRACVHCQTIIEHESACKHMQCRSCKKKFCWVCLSIPKNGLYPCGQFNHYCGKVAQAQKFIKVQTT